MTVKLKKFFKICNFVLGFIIAPNFCAIYSSEEALDIIEEAVGAYHIRLTPRSMPILQKEFNPVARGLYEDCVYGASIGGKTALEKFKQIYPDLSSLTKDVREYIENIHFVQKVTSDFIEKLNVINAKVGVDRLKPLIESRRSLILSAAHCAFDFTNEDLGLSQRLFTHLVRAAYGTSMITEAMVGVDGVIHTINRTPTLTMENECRDHPDFGNLCRITAEFISGFLAIKPIIDRLSTTERLTRVVPVVIDKAEKKEQEIDK